MKTHSLATAVLFNFYTCISSQSEVRIIWLQGSTTEMEPGSQLLEENNIINYYLAYIGLQCVDTVFLYCVFILVLTSRPTTCDCYSLMQLCFHNAIVNLINSIVKVYMFHGIPRRHRVSNVPI